MNKKIIFKRYDMVVLFDSQTVGSVSKDFFLEALNIKDKDKNNPNYNFMDFGLAKGFHMIEKKLSVIFEQNRLRVECQNMEEPSSDLLLDIMTPILEKIDAGVNIIGYGFNFEAELTEDPDSPSDILETHLKELKNLETVLSERAGVIFERSDKRRITAEIIKDLENNKNFVTSNFHTENQEIKTLNRSQAREEIKDQFDLSIKYFEDEVISKFCEK